MTRTLITFPFPSPIDAQTGDVVVITPHRAAATALGARYYSLPRLAQRVLRESRGLTVAPNVFARHTLKRVIAATIKNADPGSMAVRLKTILQTVLRTGIDVDSLIERGSPRVRELGIITKEYKAELLKNSLIDNAELLWAAAHCNPEPRPLFVYGHHRARKEEIVFIDAIAGDGSTFYLPCHEDGIFTGNREWAERLVSFGWQTVDNVAASPETTGQTLVAKFTSSTKTPSGCDAISYPNIESEVRGTLSRIKKMIVEGTDPYEIAIVCRDQDSYAPVVDAVACEYGMPVRIGHNVPLNSTVFGGFVRLMLDAVDQSFGYESTARFMMHPFGPGLPDGVWTVARQTRTSGPEGWGGLGIDLTSMDWPAAQTLTGWTNCTKRALEAFGVRKKAANRTREILAYDKFIESLSAVEKIEGDRDLKLEEFSAIVAEVLADDSVPFSPGAVGVALFEPNTILGAEFDHLFVIGMAEGMLPAPARENPVIDFFERKLLGQHGIEFEEAAEVARWEALSFYLTLLAGKRTVSFSYPSSLDNGELMPNSFFDRLGLKPTKAPVDNKIVSSTEELRTVLLRTIETPSDDNVMLPARLQYAVELNRENSPDYDEYDGVIGVPIDPCERQWSASQLTAIGQCGFRWFAQRILKLDSVDEIELGMDYTKRGTFYHKVLEIAVSRAMAEEDVRAATLRHLDAAFAEAEKSPDAAIPTLLNWDLQRAEHIAALRKAVESPEFISDGARVIGLEQKFEETWNGFRLIGYIDRVDETPDGLIAIDYKTSTVAPKGAKDESGKLTVDVQIPLYSNVALKKLYPAGTLGNSVYYSLVKGKVLRAEKEDDFVKLDGLVNRIKETLSDGNFAVDPDADEQACTYCSFDQVCRKGPRLERKTANT